MCRKFWGYDIITFFCDKSVMQKYRAPIFHDFFLSGFAQRLKTNLQLPGTRFWSHTIFCKCMWDPKLHKSVISTIGTSDHLSVQNCYIFDVTHPLSKKILTQKVSLMYQLAPLPSPSVSDTLPLLRSNSIWAWAQSKSMPRNPLSPGGSADIRPVLSFLYII